MNSNRAFLLCLVISISMIIGLFTETFALRRKVIKIGVAAPLTGNNTSFGDNIKAGISLKLEEINNAGGINGRKIQIVWGDDRCEPEEAKKIGSKFAADKTIVAVIGHICSSATIAALPIYVKKKLACLSPTSTNVAIGAVGKGYFFRNVYHDDFQGTFLAEYAKKILNLKKIAIFYENDDYAVGLKDAFITAARTHDVEITNAESYLSKTTDFSDKLSKVLSVNPDAIFLCGYYREGGLIAKQARQKNFYGPFFGADGIDNVDYVKIAGDAADKTYITVPFLSDVVGDEAKEFIDRFREKYGRDVDWMSANAYDCLGIIAHVLKECGKKPKRTLVHSKLAAMKSKKNGYKGITGITYFNSLGDCQKPAYVKKVQSGKFVSAEQLFK